MTQPAIVSTSPAATKLSASGTPPSRPRTPNPSPLQRHRPPHHDRPSVFIALQSLLHLIVIAIFIITFCVQPFRIPSESMESTLLVGDFLLVDKQAAAPDGAGGYCELPPPVRRSRYRAHRRARLEMPVRRRSRCSPSRCRDPICGARAPAAPTARSAAR